jgi:Phage-related protein
MIHDFEYNGRKLSELGAVISENPHYALSVRELNFDKIPQKSGDIITDKKRFKNLSVTYNVTSVPTFANITEQSFVNTLSEWLLSTYEYGILRDTYSVGYFRKAVVTGITEPSVIVSGVVSAKVTFNSDPFLYSDIGINTISLTSANNAASATIINPEQWDSEPIIKINGSGNFSVSVGNVSFNLTGVNNYIIIDKPNEDVYDSGGSCNDKLSGLYLPTLKAGENNITITGNNSFSIDITPNWRRL